MSELRMYLDQLKIKFRDRPHIYEEFWDIMMKFKSRAIDTPSVIRRVASLFHGNNHLVLGFNTFLPDGYRIELPMNGSSWPVYREPGRAGVVTIHPPPGLIPMPVDQRPPYLPPHHQHYDAYYHHHHHHAAPGHHYHSYGPPPPPYLPQHHHHAAPGYHHHSYYNMHVPPYHPPPHDHLSTHTQQTLGHRSVHTTRPVYPITTTNTHRPKKYSPSALAVRDDTQPTAVVFSESRDPPSEESHIESDQRDDNLQAYRATEAKRKAKRARESEQQRAAKRVKRIVAQQQAVEREKKQQQYLAIVAQQRAVEREKKQQQYLAKSQTIDVSSLVGICLRRNIKIGIYYEEQINHMQAELTERIVDKYRSIFESMNEEKRTLLEELGSSYDRVLHTPKPGFDSVVIRCIEIGIPECEMKWYLRLHGEYNSVPFIGNSSDDRLLNYLRKDTYKVKRTTWIMGKRDKNKATPRNVQDVFSEANIQNALAATRTVFLHLGHANPNESAEKGRCKLSSQLQTVEL